MAKSLHFWKTITYSINGSIYSSTNDLSCLSLNLQGLNNSLCVRQDTIQKILRRLCRSPSESSGTAGDSAGVGPNFLCLWIGREDFSVQPSVWLMNMPHLPWHILSVLLESECSAHRSCKRQTERGLFRWLFPHHTYYVRRWLENRTLRGHAKYPRGLISSL